uniref:Glycosyltransferase n=1 Tax=Oscillatoriales cyanobacterium SpSt-402 TaxID=2282168 RepID=A0A832M3J0_9CYAN
MIYSFVISARAYRISENSFAMESAFCEHIRTLKAMLAPRFSHFIIFAVGMTSAEYEKIKSSLGIINEEQEQISMMILYDADISSSKFWLSRFIPLLNEVYQVVRKSDLIHSHYAHNLTRPIEFSSLIFGVLTGKKTISVTDIDLRRDAEMNFYLKKWSLKSYLICKYIYDPIRVLQHWFIVRFCSLALFKEQKLCDDYGRGRTNVKLMLDPNFSQEYIISNQAMESKIHALSDPEQPLELLYFGRLVYYKGVDRCIQALAQARNMGANNVHFSIIGSGEEADNLRTLVKELNLEDYVTFHPPIPYGETFLEKLRYFHLMLATPLSGDTPRSTWDAIASGIPVLAFDTPFYKSMSVYTGAVDVVPWPSVEHLAKRIEYYSRNKAELVPMVRKAVAVSHENTQEIWLQKRVDWTNELFESVQ